LTYRGYRQKQAAAKELEKRNSLIRKGLEEKELLLKEIHHRVKNNLQFISALLGLQTDHVSDKGALAVLKEGQDRVQSMALIHQDLYQREDLTSVNVKDYFEKLIRGLFDSYNVRPEQVKLEMQIEDIDLDVDSVVPIGLIVNELVSNSLKYAFSGERHGSLFLTLMEVKDELILRVADDGIGITDEVQATLGSSLGYKLIQALTNQISGSYELVSDEGTEVTIRIKRYQKSTL